MKPLNNDNPGCNPISSNCVIWQGPDIPCIKLCKGDTVSDTVYKLATELCNIIDQLDVTTYDLSCLNIVDCDPKDFHALIQLLIDRICALNECCAGTGTTTRTGVCPDDCIVEICPQFRYQDQYGNTVTTMALKDYVIAIGNRVCSIIQQITTINQILQNHETRITYIENNCCNEPEPPLPSIVPVCIGTPPNPLVLDDFVHILEVAFCELRDATGTATELYTAINKQCPGLDNDNQLSGPGIMATIPGWVTNSNYGTVADAITNMWLTICDMRAAIKYIQDNCCPTACSDFVFNVFGSYTNPFLTLYFSGTVIPAGFESCNILGTLITITDNLGNVWTGYVNIPTTASIDLTTTGLSLAASTYTVTGSVCITNPADGSQCTTTINYVINNTTACPTLELSSTSNSISYTFAGIASTTYNVSLYYTCGSDASIATNTHTPALTGPVTGTFTGLASNSSYVVVVTVNDTVCPCLPITTQIGECNPPEVITAEVQLIIL
jgi:hypothetical protein